MLVCTFSLGDIYLGIDIVLVREINRSTDYTPIPGAPEHIRGMLNIRGRVITLFDLKHKLGLSDSEPDQEDDEGEDNGGDDGGGDEGTEDDGGSDGDEAMENNQQFNIIMKTHGEVMRINQDLANSTCVWDDPVGLVVDRLGDVREIMDNAIQPSPANLNGISSDFVQGVVELEHNLLVILNLASIFGSEAAASGE